MHRISAPVAFLAALLLSMAPASSQTISSLTLDISNAAGPVTSCPVTINFVAKINLTWPQTLRCLLRHLHHFNTSGSTAAVSMSRHSRRISSPG